MSVSFLHLLSIDPQVLKARGFFFSPGTVQECKEVETTFTRTHLKLRFHHSDSENKSNILKF